MATDMVISYRRAANNGSYEIQQRRVAGNRWAWRGLVPAGWEPVAMREASRDDAMARHARAIQYEERLAAKDRGEVPDGWVEDEMDRQASIDAST